MFVRWKRRERTRQRKGTGEWVKQAVLVQSVRTQDGPRQKYVTYLGSVREGHEDLHWNRLAFWTAVGRNLDRVGVAGALRKRIVTELESVVKKPDAASRAAAQRELAKLESVIARRRGTRTKKKGGR
jgi:hypothetical protein